MVWILKPSNPKTTELYCVFSFFYNASFYVIWIVDRIVEKVCSSSLGWVDLLFAAPLALKLNYKVNQLNKHYGFQLESKLNNIPCLFNIIAVRFVLNLCSLSRYICPCYSVCVSCGQMCLCIKDAAQKIHGSITGWCAKTTGRQFLNAFESTALNSVWNPESDVFLCFKQLQLWFSININRLYAQTTFQNKVQRGFTAAERKNYPTKKKGEHIETFWQQGPQNHW